MHKMPRFEARLIRHTPGYHKRPKHAPAYRPGLLASVALAIAFPIVLLLAH